MKVTSYIAKQVVDHFIFSRVLPEAYLKLFYYQDRPTIKAF